MRKRTFWILLENWTTGEAYRLAGFKTTPNLNSTIDRAKKEASGSITALVMENRGRGKHALSIYTCEG